MMKKLDLHIIFKSGRRLLTYILSRDALTPKQGAPPGTWSEGAFRVTLSPLARQQIFPLKKGGVGESHQGRIGTTACYDFKGHLQTEDFLLFVRGTWTIAQAYRVFISDLGRLISGIWFNLEASADRQAQFLQYIQKECSVGRYTPEVFQKARQIVHGWMQ
ncbi:MAG: hypothetical protein H7832_10990 [Magnetococcus sp. DMHC-6]